MDEFFTASASPHHGGLHWIRLNAAIELSAIFQTTNQRRILCLIFLHLSSALKPRSGHNRAGLRDAHQDAFDYVSDEGCLSTDHVLEYIIDFEELFQNQGCCDE